MIGRDESLGHFTLTVCKEPDLSGNGSQFYRALLRTAEVCCLTTFAKFKYLLRETLFMMCQPQQYRLVVVVV